MQEALSLAGDNYCIHRVKSLLQVEMGDYSAAIKLSNKSLELGAYENKDESMRINERDIKKWKELPKLQSPNLLNGPMNPSIDRLMMLRYKYAVFRCS